MVGSPENYGSTDWLNKASPDQLVQQATAIFGKIAAMDTGVQERFVQEIKNNPTASRLFDRLTTS